MNRISQTVPYQYDTGFSPYTVQELDTALADLERFGFTGVEYAVAFPDKVDPDALLARTEPHKLAVTTLSTGQAFGLLGVYLTAEDDALRQGAVDIVQGQIRLSSRIGRPPVTVGLLRGKGENPDKARLDELFTSSLAPCLETAAKLGVTVQVEAICKAETGYLNSNYEVLALWEKLGKPENFGLLYDVYHSHLEDGDMPTVIHAIGSRITNVHFADSNRGLPGDGDIDFAAVMTALRKVGYQGAIALENKSVPTVAYNKAHYAEAMRRAVNS